MKKFMSLLVVAQLWMSLAAQAVVVETKKMATIQQYINHQTWVVFDLDNTVMEPVQTLGSDQWFDHIAKASGVDHAIALWETIQPHTAMQPVEPGTPALIRKLQRTNKVFALTARPENVAEVTRKQLATMGVKFGKIVSIGPKQSKGEAMLEQIRDAGTVPARLVFVDDKAKHTKSVDESLNTLGLEHYEFRYGAADPKVHGFNAEIAALQLEVFEDEGVLISDAEARRRLGVDPR